MKKSLLLPLALAILIPTVTFAQDRLQPASHSSRHKTRTAAGLVSSDARTFVDARHNPWIVANPEAVAGFENQRVTVKFALVPSQKQIQILSIKPAPAQVQIAAYKSDSAFRR